MLNLHNNNNNTQGAEQSSLIARDNCNFLRVIKLEDVNYMLVFHLWSEDLCAPLNKNKTNGNKGNEKCKLKQEN